MFVELFLILFDVYVAIIFISQNCFTHINNNNNIIIILFFYSANSRMADRCAVQEI